MDMRTGVGIGVVILLCGGWLALPGAESPAPGTAKVDFARDIQPILAQHCTACHGFDPKTRKADLRLDVREVAVAQKAIVPGDPKASHLITRIESTDEGEQMPPPAARKPLSDKQKKLLRAWIEQGAPYTRHWAFVPPVQPPIPEIRNPQSAIRNPIDAFVLARLEKEGLKPSPEADKATLLRRVTLDLTGLPPTLSELDAFLADTSPDAYERVVDRLLASPRYAERMALAWLDTARYADSNGFNNDEARTQWPWRDWVLDAFRRNLPYDRFVVEQLAGDLLPDATLSQRVASAFHRNQVYNTEGGIIPEEYRVEYVADRVHTTATVFLGLSMQCARCHDHKFDPISQREYYQFAAFFNSVIDRPPHTPNLGPGEPFVRVPSLEHQNRLAELERQRLDLDRALRERETGVDEAVRAWEKGLTPDAVRKLEGAGLLLRLPLDETKGDAVLSADGTRRGTVRGKPGWVPGKVAGALEFDGNTHVEVSDGPALEYNAPFTIALWAYPTAGGAGALLSKMDDAAAYRGYDVLLEEGKVAVHLVHHWPDNAIKVLAKKGMSQNAWHHVAVTYDGSGKAAGLKVYVDGKLEALDTTNDTLKGTLRTEKAFHLGKRQTSLPFKGKLDEVQVYGEELTGDDVARLVAGLPANLAAGLFAVPPEQRTPAQQARLRRFYLERVDTESTRLRSTLADVTRQRAALEKDLPVLMVMRDQTPPRDTFILKRGQYDQPGEKVTSGVPAALPQMPPGAPANRLGLATWLVDPANPLTARVAVNRWWHMLFGVGLVKTIEDFGVTGEQPSHPELLDWLATQLVRDGWDVKVTLRRIVTSATYRQSSRMTREQHEADPDNRLLARGARYRLPAETIRDNALAISGLLRDRLGGPSVKPYQPAGLWEDVTVSRSGKYVADQGDGLYRRSLYTFWKRTCPPPALMTFDAPNREVCLPRRAVTNTPLQALILFNDPTYVEAARVLAERMLREGGTTPEERISFAFRRALSRPAKAEEVRILSKMHDEALTRFRADREKARQLLAVGDSRRDSSLDEVEHAAWTTVASTILNLDETISRR
jgi:hypothetical protein